MRRSIFAFNFLLIGLLSFVQPAMVTEAATVEKIRVAYSAIGGSQASVWIPYEVGLFRKHGLDIELLYVSGGSRAAQVVQSGEVPIGIFSGAAVVSSNAAGGDLVIIASCINVMPWFLIGRPEIRGPDDLKNKKIGITLFGSATDFALRHVEEKWGLRRGRDFSVIQVSGFPEMLLALRKGLLDAATLTPELSIIARKDGLREIVDFSTMGIEFPTSSINTTRSYVRRNEQLTERFVRAYVEGIHYAKTERATSIGVLRKYLKRNDSNFLDAVYDLYIQQYIPAIPHPSVDAIKTVVAQMAEKDQRLAAVRPEQSIDPRFMKSLENEGFTARLWNK